MEKLKKAEAELAKSQEELKAAIADTKKKQDEQDQKISDLTTKSQDQKATQVARSKAAMDLAAAKQEDPMPLRKAKLTQEAASRRVEKSLKETADDMAKTESALKEASEYLQRVASGGGDAKGALWFMKRELLEAQKYLPKSKQQEIKF